MLHETTTSSGEMFWHVQHLNRELLLLIHVVLYSDSLPSHCTLPFRFQEPEPDDSGPGSGEVSSWDLNTERVTTTVGKLCKTESQNHMSPRYSAKRLTWKQSAQASGLLSVFALISLLFFSSFVLSLVKWKTGCRGAPAAPP